MSVRVEHGDSREVLKALADCSVHSCVTDPPYSLVSIQKRWSKAGPIESSTRKVPGQGQSPHMRGVKGFMGKTWDNGTTAFDPEFWAEVWRVLKPGAHLVAFGGTRTYHRLVCAIEDAGFEIRDQFAWLFGAGFPKSHNLHDAWDGWGTALKPAFEPIILARKPLSEKTVAANMARWGTGAINVDGCRVETTENLNGGAYSGNLRQRPEYTSSDAADGSVPLSRLNRGAGDYAQPPGRWPANLIHDGSEEVIAAFPDVGRAGISGTAGRHGFGTQFVGGTHKNGTQLDPMTYGDSGSAARFFYSAKADNGDRLGSKHPTVKPVDLMRWLVRLVTPPVVFVCEQCNNRPHENSTTPPSGVSPVRNLQNDVQASRQSEAQTVLFDGMRVQGDGSTSAAGVRVVPSEFQTGSSIKEGSVLLKDVREQGDISEAREGLCDHAARVSPSISSATSASDEGGLHHGAPSCGRGDAGQSPTENGSGSSPKRKQTRQQTRKSSGDGQASSRQNTEAGTEADHLSALRGEDKGLRTCPSCGGPLTERRGIVLDPFAGTGTTGMACMAEGFDCILIEREAGYIADIKNRIAHVSGENTPLFSGEVA